MAAAQTKKVMDLLDLTAAQKAKLNSWADARGYGKRQIGEQNV
ncbi:hypothetical protein AC518_2253 [Pseudomonas syringae pv. syringae]|nr:hypothetical protein AC518_2253 [Pseudomonas syringae pv. syringae]